MTYLTDKKHRPAQHFANESICRLYSTGLDCNLGAQASLFPHHVWYRVGGGSLLLLIGLGEGFRAGTRKGLASLGEDYMQIYNGRVPALGGSQISSRQYDLNYHDYVDIRNSPDVRNAAPIIYAVIFDW